LATSLCDTIASLLLTTSIEKYPVAEHRPSYLAAQIPFMQKHAPHLLVAAALLGYVALRTLRFKDLFSLCFVTAWRLTKAGHSL